MIIPARRSALVAAASIVCLAGGCTTTRPARGGPDAEAGSLRETGTVLALVRQGGWKEVMDLLPVLDKEAGDQFPGVTALAGDIRAVAATSRSRDGVPVFDPARLVDHNPNFWRAFYEIAPGDPLMALLHTSLLLAAGEAARADIVATLAINYGRMDLEYRKDLVRLDASAQLLLQGVPSGAPDLAHVRRPAQFSALGERARAMLAVWPRNPTALADLMVAQWGLAGRPHGVGEGTEPGRTLADLRRADPFFAVDPVVVGTENAAVTEARRLWLRVNETEAIGDDQLLRRFSEAAQRAGADEIALVARSLLNGWNTGLPPLDEDFVHRSVARLLGEKTAGALCADAFSEDREWIGLGSATDAPSADFGGEFVHPQLEQRLLVEIAETSYWIESGLLQGTDLADCYAQRGEAWAEMRRAADAESDLHHALELNPKDNQLNYSLAVILSDAGDFQAADAMFATAQKQAAPDAAEMQDIGNHLFKQGRFAEAEAAYAQAAQLDSSFAYAWLMRDLARCRQGKPPGARSDPRLEKHDPWGGSLLGFVAGRIDQKTLFSRLESQGGLRYSEEECELYFVLAELALSRGDVAEARRDLHSCMGTGITDFVEYTMAWHELKRLDAANPPPPSPKSRGGDSMDDEPV